MLMPAVREVFQDSRETYGTVRVRDSLRDIGIMTSIRRVRRIMRRGKLVPRRIRRFRCTTKRGPDTSHIRDLVERDFTASAPNKIWVGDITEIMTFEGRLYLAFILDLFSRYAVGWATSATKTTGLVINALSMAAKRRDPPEGFVFYSDHGSQYGAEFFQTILRFHGGVPSMGSVGDCFDNAVSESFVSTLKGECLNCENLVSREFTNRLLFDFIDVFYNRKRKHSTIENMSPLQYESAKHV